MNHEIITDTLAESTDKLNNVTKRILKTICGNIGRNNENANKVMGFYEEIYKLSYSNHKILSPMLIYDKACFIVQEFIKIKILPNFRYYVELSDIEKYWKVFKNNQKIIAMIFSLHDRYKRTEYLNENIYYRVSITHRSHTIFKNVLTKNKLLYKMSDCILSKIEDMRNNPTNIRLMQSDVISAIRMFIEINIINDGIDDDLINNSSCKNIPLLQYKKHVEDPYVKSISVRYRSIIDAMHNLSCSEYHSRIAEYVDIEHRFINIFFTKSLKIYLRNNVYEILVHDGIKHLSNNNFDVLVQSNENCLGNIYSLYNESDKQDINELITKNFITELNKIIDMKTKEIKLMINGKYIDKIVEVKDKYDEMGKKHFEKNNLLNNLLNKSLITFINNIDDISYILAQYSNIIINNKQGKGFDNVVAIFSCLENKDYYENYYITKLESRLISRFNKELEYKLLRRLKLVGDFSWCKRIEKMICDVVQSTDLNTEYKRYNKKDRVNEFIICTGGTWAKIKQCDYISKLVRNDIDNITQFYMSKFNNRKIMWNLSVSLFTVKISFGEIKRLVDINYNQLIILELFNTKQTINVGDIMNRINCGIFDIKSDLLALVRPKIGLLQKKPNSIKLLKTDKLRLNKNFPKNNPSYRVKIPVLKVKCDLTREISENAHVVRKQRNTIIDSGLTRIMKSRKTIKNNELISLLYSAVCNRFIPDMRHVKKRISHLIDIDIIVRSPNDRTVFTYIP